MWGQICAARNRNYNYSHEFTELLELSRRKLSRGAVIRPNVPYSRNS